ncbi:hypothetical protein M409DRAFT_25658 [Zasmidium cellare ATCC 36951]|uniref:Uncharacterized protein n=1 Tax=Zasmidium cellare ATCC 36951 TaxID=1080233 RepID=A0A6A6CD83_ZASCE|nr:uncharacterized protein M409DRAFT_25658 [Zasmidium cellare ATCC 36951]KAF2163882.1 hypothetical protein M409DRAFT_25658 [Zasmidium cellare ATCC 36951]
MDLPTQTAGMQPPVGIMSKIFPQVFEQQGNKRAERIPCEASDPLPDSSSTATPLARPLKARDQPKRYDLHRVTGYCLEYRFQERLHLEERPTVTGLWVFQP